MPAVANQGSEIPVYRRHTFIQLQSYRIDYRRMSSCTEQVEFSTRFYLDISFDAEQCVGRMNTLQRFLGNLSIYS